MSVLIAMTGLKAAQSDMSVTSNNIANVGTVGFHASRADFGDIYTHSPYTVARTQMGKGVQLASIKGNFAQGAIQQTSSTLDMAIEGPGFFVKSTDLQNGEQLYSRAGSFSLDDKGYIVDNLGNYLMAQQVSENGEPTTALANKMGPLRIPTQQGQPVATTAVELVMNLSSNPTGVGDQDAVPPTGAFDPEDPTTYGTKSAIKVLNAEGQPIEADVYFVKTQEPTALVQETGFAMHLMVDGQLLSVPTGQTNEVIFDAMGIPVSTIPTMDFESLDYKISVSLVGSTVSGENYGIDTYNQNGKAPRGLSNLQVDDTGLVWASYMGEDSIALGQVGMVNFNNPHGLKRIGNASYIKTLESGDPIFGVAGENGFGNIRASAVEGSNVELTVELVNLITAQRNYQASAKALETSSSLTQTIINIRN